MATPLDPNAKKLVVQALEELKRRNVTADHCPRCGTFDWSVDPVAISVIPVEGLPARMKGSYIPAHIKVLQIVCTNCGYTMFHNLNVLGLSDSD
jgi:predicted nucleic-acid-binding Zn-ribbon protein